MNRKLLAKELVRVAQILVGIEFDSQDAMDKYLKEHPDADKSNHSVKETEKKPEGEDEKDQAHSDISSVLKSFSGVSFRDVLKNRKHTVKKLESVAEKIRGVGEKLNNPSAKMLSERAIGKCKRAIGKLKDIAGHKELKDNQKFLKEAMSDLSGAVEDYEKMKKF